jgi:mono/diheme cytochrome c family protein
MLHFSMRNVVTLAGVTISLLLGASLQGASAADDADTVKRGAYVARTGDCMACHSLPDKPEYGGGLAIESPFGAIYATNISPDPVHGIGTYTEKEFSDAVRGGVRKDGGHLYPAMPYPSYAKMTDQDIHDLYVYMMKGVEPVAVAAPITDLPFPFSQRWGLMFWNWTFGQSDSFKNDPAQSAQINRGAYLVQAAGHCGSCHTPRNMFFGEKAYDGADSDFLAGAELNEWNTPDLRASGRATKGMASWSEADITEYLRTGRNQYAAVAGEMTSVIEHSTSQMAEEDVRAMAAYLKTLPPVAASGKPAETLAQERKATETHLTGATNLNGGERLYLDNCAACHFVTGQGAPKVFPPLAGNSLAEAENPAGLISVILNGARLPSTFDLPTRLAMPDFGWRLSDKQVADLATFVRSGWGNSGEKVSESDVNAIRKRLPLPAVSSKPEGEAR